MFTYLENRILFWDRKRLSAKLTIYLALIGHFARMVTTKQVYLILDLTFHDASSMGLILYATLWLHFEHFVLIDMRV